MLSRAHYAFSRDHRERSATRGKDTGPWLSLVGMQKGLVEPSSVWHIPEDLPRQARAGQAVVLHLRKAVRQFSWKG